MLEQKNNILTNYEYWKKKISFNKNSYLTFYLKWKDILFLSIDYLLYYIGKTRCKGKVVKNLKKVGIYNAF